MAEQETSYTKDMNVIRHQNAMVGTIQPVPIVNCCGVQTTAKMLITGVDTNDKLKWERPYPYLDCVNCGYGPYGCDCPGGFIQ